MDRPRALLFAHAASVLAFSLAYWTLWKADSGSFSGAARCYADFVYFSITTQTTVGYGDIVPLTASARFYVALQHIVVLLFAADLVADAVRAFAAKTAKKQIGAL